MLFSVLIWFLIGASSFFLALATYGTYDQFAVVFGVASALSFVISIMLIGAVIFGG